MRLDKIKKIVALNNQGVFTTFRRSGAIQMSIVTVGVLAEGVGFTVSPRSAKLVNLKRSPRCSLMVCQNDWREYAVIEGCAQLLSPDVSPTEELRLTLREVYRAGSGKEHPDWDEFDQAVQKDRRSAAIIVPEHVYYGSAG